MIDADTRHRVRLLASVADPDEAELAVAGGADLVDLKDPTRGALGALGPERIRAILSQVAGRRPTSATIGDLPADPDLLWQAIRTTGETGVDYVKIGFFSPEHLSAGLPAVADLAAEHRIVAVLFADRDPPLAELDRFARAGCAGVMLDTADKSGGNLRERLDTESLGAFVRSARALGLLCGLAGSLRLADLPGLVELQPDYLGLRGALCSDGQRTQTLDPARLRQARTAIPIRFDEADDSRQQWNQVPKT
jgi:(5-formylfuran-3-yl)methyl phosphate synthase